MRSLLLVVLSFALGVSVAVVGFGQPTDAAIHAAPAEQSTIDMSWFVQPDEDVSGDLSNTYANVAELPFSPSTTQSYTMSGGTQSGTHTWGLPDMSSAPGPAKGFRALIMMRGSGGTGLNVDVSLFDGVTEISAHPQMLMLDTFWFVYAFHFSDEDFESADLDDLRLHLDFERAGGNNQIMSVAGVAVSKSPIAEQDEAEGFGPLAGAERAAYRAADLVDLGGSDEDDVPVWPDATGRGQHLVWAAGSVPTLGVDGSDAWVESEDGRIAGVMDEPIAGFSRMMSFRPDALSSPPLPVSSAAYMSTASDYAYRWDTSSPLEPDSGYWDKNLLGHRTSPKRTVIMHSDGSVPAHADGSIDLEEGEWHMHTGYVPTSGASKAWLDDDLDSSVSPVGSVNLLQRMSFFDRESDDRPAIGAIGEMYFFDMDGLDDDDLAEARDEWLSGGSQC